jgi:triosephosphate isomerase
MRKPLVAGNWKMNKTAEEARLLVEVMLPELQKINGVEQVICPPYTSLMTIAAVLAGSGIGLGRIGSVYRRNLCEYGQGIL